MSLVRLNKEKKEMIENNIQNISAGPKNDNMYEWEGVIFGPTETPYEGGVFFLDIHIPQNYPFAPPQITFRTKVYHPNINSSGHICLDILKGDWSPSLTISKILLSICSLLTDPNNDSPLVAEIAKEYKTNYEQYKQHAREWTIQYAMQ